MSNNQDLFVFALVHAHPILKLYSAKSVSSLQVQGRKEQPLMVTNQLLNMHFYLLAGKTMVAPNLSEWGRAW